ncbi:hypothetical protein AEM00_03515 [Lactobacillus crispatus]|nr:hypothetical protein AEM00_03515 [Lactobacillus crispatus]
MKEFFFLFVVFCSNQSYEKGTPFSNVLRNKFKELFILTQNILQSHAIGFKVIFYSVYYAHKKIK